MDNEELDGVKFSEFPSQTPVNSDEVVGLHSGDNARFSIANIVAAVRNGLASIFVPKTDVGAANGVAELDSTGKVPSSQLPPISSDASDITYDPTTSGLTATNVQDAIDEVAGDVDNKQSTITASGILMGDGAGGVTAAVAGTDYQAPLTAGTDYATPAQLADKANQSSLTIHQTALTGTDVGTALNTVYYNDFMVQIVFVSAGKTWSDGSLFGYLPSDLIPPNEVKGIGIYPVGNKPVQIIVNSNTGGILAETGSSITGRISFNVIYFRV